MTEKEQLREEGEAKVAELAPLLEVWQQRFSELGFELSFKVEVSNWPYPNGPLTAGLFVSQKNSETSHIWIETLDKPVEQVSQNLATRLEADLAKRKENAPWGGLHADIRDLAFHWQEYDVPNDHTHCSCCHECICIEGDETAGYVHGANPGVWLCKRCFDFYRERRNFRVN